MFRHSYELNAVGEGENMARGKASGPGMGTIGGREIALEIWREEKECKLHEEQRNEALIQVKNADLGDRAKDFEVDVDGLTHLCLTKAREVWLRKQQRQGESLGKTVARLIAEGKMAFPPKS